MWVEAETGMRPQEIQTLRYSNITKSEGYWVLKISDSFSEKKNEFNGHLKSRKIGEWRLPPPPLLMIYTKRCMISEENSNGFCQKKGLKVIMTYFPKSERLPTSTTGEAN